MPEWRLYPERPVIPGESKKSASGARNHRQLLPLVRAIAGLLSIAVLGVGAISVLREGSAVAVAGVPLLIAAGVVFGYLAVGGQRLRSLKFGEHAAVEFAGDLLNDVLTDERIPEEARVEYAARAKRQTDAVVPPEVDKVVERTLSAAESAQQYEIQVAAKLEEVLVRAGGPLAVADNTGVPGPRRHQSLADIEVTAGSNTGYIEMLWSRRSYLESSRIASFLAALINMGSLTSDGQSPPALIVTNLPLAASATSVLRSWPNVRSVTWRNESDDETLANAVQLLLSALR